jgi:multiple antibiotic resistance protein
MIAFVLAAFTALFVTVNPIKGAALFAVLSGGALAGEQRRLARRAVLVASGLLLVFALLGDDLLRVIGISLAGVRVGGGILLMLLSIDIVFGRSIGPPGPGGEARADISVFPLATPIIAGPGAITSVVVHATEAGDRVLPTLLLVMVLGVVMAITYVAFLLAATTERWLGESGMNAVSRALGILLAAVSAEMILDGLGESGVFGPR